MKKLDKNLIISVSISITLLTSGCSFLNVLRTRDVTKQELTSAFKYRSKNTKSISIGMTTKEVIATWGEPSHVYKPEIKNEYNHYSDEFWIYTKGFRDLAIGEKDISYEVYFDNGKIIKIIELEWIERIVNLFE